MPVNTTSSTKQFTGDGAQTTFPVTYPISGEGDIVVKKRVTATGVTTTQALTTHYTVVKSGANFDNGFNVEMKIAPAATDTLIVKRATTQTQSTDLRHGDTHDSEAYEGMANKLARSVQELQAQIDRCIKIPDTDAEGLNTELENSVLRASNYIGLDASGGAISAATFADYGAASVFIQTLLDDADLATAQNTLFIDGYDLVVDSVADLELLKSGDATTYARVFIKHGSYTTAELLDFDAHGVEYLCGERRDTTIVMTNALVAGNLITLKADGIYERFTVSYTGAIHQTDVNIIKPKTESNNAMCRDISVIGSAGGAGDGVGFSYINCLATDSPAQHGGSYGCSAQGGYDGFERCHNVCGCWVDDQTHNGFNICFSVNNCTAGNCAIGFYGGEQISTCFAEICSSYGFGSVHNMSACKAQDCGEGFHFCLQMSGCQAKDSTGDGFNNCDQVSACTAAGSGGDGFEDCDCLSACKSGSSTGYDYNDCDYLSSCLADATGAANWNACAEVDGDSCNNA